MKKVLCIFGTRPEAIKLAPIIFELNRNKNKFMTKICVTGQHNEMISQVFKIFNFKKNYDLQVMKKNQKLEDLTAVLISKISKVLDHFKPDIVIVHGDTTSTFAASLSAFYKKIRVCHIEAGLRTNNLYSPYPEEMYRKFTAMISHLHFAPTKNEKNNLIKEGVSKNNIYITGNTVVDSLKIIISKLKNDKKLIKQLNKKFSFIDKDKKLILITFHRRENFGSGLKNLITFLIKSIKNRNDIQFVYPVHLNPNIYKPVIKSLSKINNIHIIKPVDYLTFVYLMMQSYFILTDSGGIQEEAPSLKKPVLVLRNTSERLHFSNSRSSIIVGTNEKKITLITSKMLNNKKFYKSMIFSKNPYGDGKASKKIINILNKLV